MSDSTVLIKFKGDTKDVDSKLSGLSKSMGGMTKKFVAGNLISKALASTFRTIANNTGDAIKRFDTMRNFPKVMKNLGVKSEDADASIKKLSTKLKGLPTALDTAAMSVQRLTSKNGDVKKSTNLFLAMNNAILAGGAPANLQAQAIEQLSQAYAKGKPDMMEWRSLMNAMPAQLKQVANAMGYADAEMLGMAVRAKGGEKEFSRMMDTMMKMNTEGVKGFKSLEQQARDATGGISTSMVNAQTAIVRGLTNVITAIDAGLNKAGLGGLAQVISNSGARMETILNKVAVIIPPVIKLLVKFKTEIYILIGILGSLKVALMGLNAYKSIFGLIQDFQMARVQANLYCMSVKKVTMHQLLMNKQLSTTEKLFVMLNKTQLGEKLSSIGTSAQNGAKGLLNFASKHKLIAGASLGLIGVLAGLGVMLIKNGGDFNAVAEQIKGVFNKVITAVTNIAKQIPQIIKKIVPQIINFVTGTLPQLLSTIVNMIKSVASKIAEMLPVIIPAIVDFLSVTLPGLIIKGAEAISDAIIKIGDKIPQIVDRILPKIINYFENGLPKLVDSFVKVLENITKTIDKTLPKIVKTIEKTLPKVISAVVKIIPKVVEAITKALPAIINGIVTLVNGVVKMLPKVLPALIQGVVALIRGIVGAIGTILPPLIQAVITIITTLAGMIGTILPPLISAVIEGAIMIVQALVQALPQIIVALVAAIPQIIVALVNGLIKCIPSLVRGCIQLVVGIVKALPQIIGALIKAVPTIIKGIIQAMLKQAPQFIQTGIQLIQDLWKGFKSWISQLWTNVKNFIKQLPTRLKQGAGNLRSVGSTFLIDLWNGIKTKTGSVLSSIGNFAKSIPRRIKNGVGNLGSIGRNLIGGLWGGIKAKFNSVIDGVRNLASKLPKAVRKVLGIESPSKVMFELGGYTTEGFMEGISSMSKALDKTIATTFSLSPNVTGSMNNHFSPNVNITNNVDVSTDPLGQTVNKIKTFAGGAKNDYNYGVGL